MARALSRDLRDRVVAATEGGMSCRAATVRLGVGVATAVRWRQMAREHGGAIAGKPGGDQRFSKTDAHADLIAQILTENGDITLAKIQSGLATRGVLRDRHLMAVLRSSPHHTQKKDRARDRARPPRHSKPAPGLVRRPVRSGA